MDQGKVTTFSPEPDRTTDYTLDNGIGQLQTSLSDKRLDVLHSPEWTNVLVSKDVIRRFQLTHVP
jgi:hypothetical protein